MADVQRVVPYLYYADGRGAIEWLCKAFGFQERMVAADGAGNIMHAELEYEGCVVALGTPRDDKGNPHPFDTLPFRHASVLVYVDDVDAHYARAKAAGAGITIEPSDRDYGARSYSASDLEGQVWHFSTQP